MSRPRVDPDEKARGDFLKEIKIKRATLDVKQRELADELDVSQSVMSGLLKRPDKISVGRLRKIIRMLGLDPMIVMLFLGYTPKELKAIKEAECHGAC